MHISFLRQNIFRLKSAINILTDTFTPINMHSRIHELYL